MLERKDWKYLAALCGICLAVCLPLFTQFFLPGGDEPGFVDPAVNLAAHGYLGTHLFEGTFPGMEQHVYWQPPLYFVVLAGWLRLFGVGLLQARLLSLACSLCIVAIVYLLTRVWTAPREAFAVSVLCSCSFWLTTHANSARMDPLCVMLSLASLLAYVRGVSSVAGLLAGLALVTHPLGVIPVAALLTNQAISKRPWRETLTVVAGIASCLGVWLVYAFRDLRDFLLQMSAQLARKQNAPPYWYQFWIARSHALSLAAVVAAGVWLTARRSKIPHLRLLSVAWVYALAAVTYGRETGYLFYFFPLGCVALGIALNANRGIGYLILVAAVANEGVLRAYDIGRYGGRSYARYARAVLAAIPPGKTVFIGYPDASPYFALLGRDELRMAPPVPVDPHAVSDTAARADYIVDSLPDEYLPEVNALLEGRAPLLTVVEDPDFRVSVFQNGASH